MTRLPRFLNLRMTPLTCPGSEFFVTYLVSTNKKLQYMSGKRFLNTTISLFELRMFSVLVTVASWRIWFWRGRPGKLGSASASFGRAKIKFAKKQKSPKQKTFWAQKEKKITVQYSFSSFCYIFLNCVFPTPIPGTFHHVSIIVHRMNTIN